MKFEELDPRRIAVLVIDMTNAFVERGAPLEVPAAREILPSLREVLSTCRWLKIPIIYTVHVFQKDASNRGLAFDFYPVLKNGCLNEGSSGVEIYPEIAPKDGDIIVQKSRYSAFFNTDLDLILRRLGRDILIITGEASEICCDSTARDAFFRDYKVLFLSDANASTSEAAHAATLRTISTGFGEVLPSKDLLKRLGLLASD